MYIRIDNTQIPKQVFYGQLHHGFRRPGGQYKRYKDCLKTIMTQCGITPSELETVAMDRTGWHSTCKSAVEEFEVRRIQELEAKRDLCKSGPPSTSNFECQICQRVCRSRIGLLAHNKSHSWWWDPSYRRLSPWLTAAMSYRHLPHEKLFLRLLIYITLQSRAWPGNDKQLETPAIMLEFRPCCCVKNSHWSKRWKWNIFTLKIPFVQQVVNTSVNTVNIYTHTARQCLNVCNMNLKVTSLLRKKLRTAYAIFKGLKQTQNADLYN